MALKKLPNDVQSLLCASAQINSFKRAMEELIYNSLDAGSTSIAIRIHIQESTIQVIDSGHGIAKTDFHLIGQRYMTSKVMDVATLKAAPKNYGYRGEFLANIIAVSQMVKVTSRHESSEDTWTKIFLNGKEKKFTKMTTRPTKGTTVDIKGFLYNLNIQKRGIDPMNELQNIKMFLEQLSLVHNHISLSLRDDSQNEIVFKIHKKRDIYQTLSNLFNIDKKDVQELQVEKNEYKVKGFIGKVDKELDLHWIYVNRKFIHNSSKLHKIINEYFKKCLNIRDQTRLKSKMLEKVVKFFIGDVKLKEIKNVEKIVSNTDRRNDKESNDTRDQVKKIIEKILGSNSKKLGVSQLQNGVKDVCETVLHEIGSGEREFDFTFNENHRRNDSLYNISPNNCDIINAHENQDNLINFNKAIEENADDVSHHFNNMVQTTNDQLKANDNIENNILDKETTEKNQPKSINEDVIIEDLTDINIENNLNVEQDCNFEINNFNLKNRPRFVPKGMSQIFENCRTKTACDYTLDKDYYEDSIYNNFVNDVQVNAEIYEPTIQNVEDLATKNVHKFQTKVKKDHASLVFDENSLKTATVFGQVDCKFIAAIMENRHVHPTEASQYLILFDQHAVHERIRLEKNLADYIIDDKWTSVAVDDMILKMSKDEILYLHNYKDKFNQLGLFWTISDDNEVIVHSIPEAILGKNPREVDKVIKAVRNVIIEEINVIKLQKGCMSLYPKSIMDLVFSEACRYAIKFGDQLSKNDCVELLSGLSSCKTPFQCAHGRPVMAVIMDIKEDKREYKINMEHFKRFKKIN
uniref:SFRICE_005849 n=1 Tax=Spodoptera frugiperda TaxID=7108 RepID=A0A2H1WC23_SPOFR